MCCPLSLFLIGIYQTMGYHQRRVKEIYVLLKLRNFNLFYGFYNFYADTFPIFSGGWGKCAWSPLWMTGWGLAGSTVGILGLGRIGQGVMQRLQGFGIKRFIYSGRSQRPQGKVKRVRDWNI